jgi:hypothetical protein
MTRIETAANLPGFVRNLGAFEEIYWLYNQLGTHGFAYAMEVDGSTTVADWRSALDAIQRSNPFFSVNIEPNNGSVPFFRYGDGAPIPLRVVDGMSGSSWQEEMAPIWGMSSMTGWDDKQIVGVATLNGQLHMTYTSQTTIPSLLPAIEELLRRACHIEA